jgi:hypothetical protein
MLTNDTVKIQYQLFAPFAGSYPIGDAAQPIRYWSRDEIRAVISSSSGDTDLVLDTDYDVSPGSSASGSLARLSDWEAKFPGAARLTIYREVRAVQPVSLPDNSRLFGATIEKMADRIVAITQQIGEALTRLVVFPVSDTGEAPVLPGRDERKNMFLAFDGYGNPFPAAGSAAGFPVSGFMKDFLQDETAGEARGKLDIPAVLEEVTDDLTGLINAEAQAREDADADLNIRVESIQGRGGYLTAHDFGTADLSDAAGQQALTLYALSQIPDITDPDDIWNGTHVKNLYVDPETGTIDGNVWALTNTPDTSPAVFEWVNDGPEGIGVATNNRLGAVRGVTDPGDGSRNGMISVTPAGEMEVIGGSGAPPGIRHEILCRDTGQALTDKLDPYRLLPLTSDALITKTAASASGTIRSLVPYLATSGTLYFANGILLYLGSGISYGEYTGKYKRLVDWVKQTLSSAAYTDSLYLTDGSYASATVTFDDGTTGVRVVYNPVADDAVSANLYLVLPDNAGIFGRGAGSQRKINEWTDSQGNAHVINTLYDGKAIGQFSQDTIKTLTGEGGRVIGSLGSVDGIFYGWGVVADGGAGGAGSLRLAMDSSLQSPGGTNTAPASVSGHYCITF